MYTEYDGDSDNSVDVSCPNLILQEVDRTHLWKIKHHIAERGMSVDEIWDLIDENPAISSDSLSSDEEKKRKKNLQVTVSWINKHQIKHNAAADLLSF